MQIDKIVFRLIVMLAISFLSSCGEHHSPQNNPSANIRYCIPDSLLKQISIDTISFKPVIQELKLIGKVTYDQDKVVKLYPLVSGNVTEVKVTLGDYVEKGEVLALVRSAEIAGAENDIVTAQANLAESEKNLAVTESLVKSGVASEKDFLTRYHQRNGRKR